MIQGSKHEVAFSECNLIIDGLEFTVWKFHDFSIIQILREINFGDSRSTKSAILANLEALNFLKISLIFALYEG